VPARRDAGERTDIRLVVVLVAPAVDDHTGACNRASSAALRLRD